VEFNGITRATAAQTMADYFGTRVYHRGGTYDTREVSDQQGRVWKLVSDASIAAPADERCELVTPICRWEDIPVLQELVRKLRAAGAKAHESCGIHVHIGRGEHTAKTLRNLVNLVNAKEDLLTQALGISGDRRDRWCRPVEQRFLEQLNRRKPKDDDALARLWYDVRTDREAERRKSYHYDDSRYHLLNLHSTFTKGTLEFRAFNSTLHAGKIKAYIQLCMAISDCALKSSYASPTRPVTDNPKYAFRCWLLKLGFIGDEFATAREHLLANLPGDSAWRNGRPAA
ncbi:amidoligase family protein, partial [Eubacteriales bacterium OttesenSCG-928-N13]|nr:amidoligase family protein [Eubacteriales bacterium OttesenSCG-928-N13]